jgi:hypothetical protein
VVKQAAARRLPAGIVFAKKKGFPTPAGFIRGSSYLLVNGRLAEVMGWSRRATTEIVAMLDADRDLCYLTVGLELWLRLFFSDETADELGDRLVALAA